MANDIYIRFRGDTSGLEGSLRRINRSLGSLDTASRRASDSMNRLQRSSAGAGASIINAKNAILAFAGGAVVRGIVSTYTEFESFRTVLATYLGSQEKANAELERLSALADGLPQDLGDITQAFTIFTRTGINTSSQALQAFSNIATANSKSLTQFAEAVADALTGEFERLKEFGVRVSQENGQFVANISNGQQIIARSSRELVDQLRALGEEGGSFGSAAANNAGTLSLAFSNLRGAVLQANVAFMDNLKPALIAVVNSTSEFLRENKELIALLGSGVAGAVSLLADNFGRLVSIATAAGVAFVSYKAAVLAATIATKGFVVALGLTRAALIRTGIGALVVLLGEAIYQTSLWIERNGGLVETFKSIGRWWNNTYESVSIRIQILGKLFEQLGFFMKLKWAEAVAFMGQKVAELVAQTGNVLNQAAELLGLEPIFDTMYIQAWASSLDAAVIRAQNGFNAVGNEVDVLRQRLAAVGTEVESVVEPVVQMTGAMRSALSDMGPYYEMLNNELNNNRAAIDAVSQSYRDNLPLVQQYRARAAEIEQTLQIVNRQLRLNTTLSAAQRTELENVRTELLRQKGELEGLINTNGRVLGIMNSIPEAIRENREAHEALTAAIVQQELWLEYLKRAHGENADAVVSTTAILVAMRAELAEVDAEFQTMTTGVRTSAGAVSALESALKSFTKTADEAAAAAVGAAQSAIDRFQDPMIAAEQQLREALKGLDTLRDRDLINEETYLRTKAGLHREYADTVRDLNSQLLEQELRNAGVRNDAILQSYLQTDRTIQGILDGSINQFQGASDIIGRALNDLSATNRRAFEAAKAYNIAVAIMNTITGVTKALSAYPPPWNFVAAAATAAAGYAQVAMIRNQQYSGRALGGPVMGNESYLVGENGPEVFTPATSGRITRNDQLDGGGKVEVYFTINAIDSRGVDQILIERRSTIQQIISDAMLEKGQRSKF